MALHRIQWVLGSTLNDRISHVLYKHFGINWLQQKIVDTVAKSFDDVILLCIAAGHQHGSGWGNTVDLPCQCKAIRPTIEAKVDEHSVGCWMSNEVIVGGNGV